jgi:N-acetylglutamate synthase
MNLTIRPFVIEDYDRVMKLWNEANLPARPLGRDNREKISLLIKNGVTIFLVAETEGEIAGTVLGTHDGRKGWINRLAVDVRFRRQHTARRLVTELETRFEELGLEITACLIEEENLVSKDFFKELGYREWDGKYYSKKKNPDY